MVELVTDYLDGALSDEDRARFEAHIAGCDGCTVYLEQIRVTVSVAGRLEAGELSLDIERALVGVFRDWQASGA
jgi:anti-sigma factor RsiW